VQPRVVTVAVHRHQVHLYVRDLIHRHHRQPVAAVVVVVVVVRGVVVVVVVVVVARAVVVVVVVMVAVELFFLHGCQLHDRGGYYVF